MLTKTILVPIDFSDCAINALKYAISIAKREQAELLLVHAFSIPVTHGEMGASGLVKGLTHGIDDQVEESFTDLKVRVPELGQVKYDTITKHNSVSEAVQTLCAAADIDMVIMGTKGAHGIEEAIIGTNTYAVVKEVHCPVLVVPQNVTFSELESIALASDYQKIDENLLEPLLTFSRLFGADIHIVHINDEPVLDKLEAAEAKKFERYFHKVNHHYHLIVNRDIEAGLTSYVKEHNIGMIAMVPRKHSLFDKIFKGPETRKMVYHTEIPMLALPS